MSGERCVPRCRGRTTQTRPTPSSEQSSAKAHSRQCTVVSCNAQHNSVRCATRRNAINHRAKRAIQHAACHTRSTSHADHLFACRAEAVRRRGVIVPAGREWIRRRRERRHRRRHRPDGAVPVDPICDKIALHCMGTHSGSTFHDASCMLHVARRRKQSTASNRFLQEP